MTQVVTTTSALVLEFMVTTTAYHYVSDVSNDIKEHCAEFGYGAAYCESHLSSDDFRMLSPYHLAPGYRPEDSLEEECKVSVGGAELGTSEVGTAHSSGGPTSLEPTSSWAGLEHWSAVPVPTSNDFIDELDDDVEYSFNRHVPMDEVFDIPMLELEKTPFIKEKLPIPDRHPGEVMALPGKRLPSLIILTPDVNQNGPPSGGPTFDPTSALNPGGPKEQYNDGFKQHSKLENGLKTDTGGGVEQNMYPDDTDAYNSTAPKIFFKQRPESTGVLKKGKGKTSVKTSAHTSAKTSRSVRTGASAKAKRKKGIKNPFRISNGAALTTISQGVLVLLSTLMVITLV